MPEASDIQLTAEWIAAVVSGVLVSGRAEQRFAGVSIDTRTLGAGELYIAIRGERFDGAEFAEAAIAAGAAGVMVPRGRRPLGGNRGGYFGRLSYPECAHAERTERGVVARESSAVGPGRVRDDHLRAVDDQREHCERH